MAKKPQVRQRGSIVAEGPGKFRVRIFIGTDANGKREYVSQRVVGSRGDAEKARTHMLRELDTQTLARPTAESVAEFVPRFLNAVKKPTVGRSTYRGYAAMARLYVLPALGRVKVSDLTPFRIQEWIRGMVERDLSYATIRHAYVVLDMALEQAVLWNMLVKNPAKLVQLPKKSRKREQEIFTPEQMHRFLAGIDTASPRYQRYAAAFYLLLLTGIRPSEVGALRWSDLQGDQLSINRALTATTSGKWAIRNYPKTTSGRRLLTVPRTALTRLESHRRRLAEEQLATGMRSDLIFPTTKGTPISPKNLHRAWGTLCDHAGVPKIRLYGARHTATSLELAAGVDIKTISRRRGHASTAFTMDTYAHLLSTADREAADALDNMLERAANG